MSTRCIICAREKTVGPCTHAEGRIFDVTHMGIVQQQVCTDAETPEEVVRLANKLAPAGTTNGWAIDNECQPNPNKCATHPTRRHWMLVC